jgi:low affinity Fe/Cu permease
MSELDGVELDADAGSVGTQDFRLFPRLRTEVGKDDMRSRMIAGTNRGPANASSWFGVLAGKTATLSGRPAAFLIAVAVVAVWGVTGPIFKYSDTWQLVINTGTTIITFLMVFLIQHTQNRDTLALQLKLDELIVATKSANNEVAAIEEKTEEQLEVARQGLRRRVAADSADHPKASLI